MASVQEDGLILASDVCRAFTSTEKNSRVTCVGGGDFPEVEEEVVPLPSLPTDVALTYLEWLERGWD